MRDSVTLSFRITRELDAGNRDSPGLPHFAVSEVAVNRAVRIAVSPVGDRTVETNGVPEKPTHDDRPPACRHPRQGRRRRAPELRRRPRPRSDARPLHPRRAGQPRPRAEERQRRLLQRQHAPQPDQRLRLPLHVLRVPRRPEEPEGLRDERRADPRTAAREATRAAAAPSCTSSAGCTISCRTTGTCNVIRDHPRRVSRTAPEGVDGGRVRLVRAADRAADARPARRDEGRRPGQPARRRGGDLPPRSPRQDLRAQGRRRRSGSASTARPTSSACARTRRCSTATSRRPSTASTT